MSAERIPQIAVVMGSCTAGGAYVPAMSDETIIVKGTGTIFLGGPPLVKAATGEEVTAEELGGADVHTRLSGVADYFAEDDDHALEICRTIVSTLQHRRSGCRPTSPRPRIRTTTRAEIYGIVNADYAQAVRRARDHRAARRRLALRRVQGALRHDAGDRVRAAARLSGRHHRQQRRAVLGVGAEGDALHRALQPARHPARLSAEHHRLHRRPSSTSAAGIAKDGAKMVHAVANSVVPKFTVIIGGSFGAGNYGMCGRAYEPRLLWMWPNARISVMGGEQAAGVLTTVKRDQLAREGKPPSPPTRSADPAPILEKYEHEGSPYYSTARLWDDGILDPAETRQALALGLSAAYNAPIPEPKFGVFRM